MEAYYEYSTSGFFIDPIQLQVYLDNYYYEDEKYIEKRFRKIADKIYSKDHNDEYKELLYKFLCERKIALGGRILANIGRDELKNVCPFNCYASQRNSKPNDSIECIFEDLKIAAHILKTEGGIGFNFSHLRPRYTYIKGSGITTPGVVGFMEIYDKSSEIITKGNDGKFNFQVNNNTLKNKIRKGAMISLLDISHPDIIEYIEAKKVPNKLTRFNMSVAISDEFMECLKRDGDWSLIFPDIYHPKYDEEWDGNIKKWMDKGYPIVEYKRMKARELWNLLIKNMYNRNEPGLYFIDNAEKYNNLSYYQHVTGVNPCFTKDTLVTILTENNKEIQKPISEVKKGDIVKSYSTSKKEIVYSKVLWSGKTGVQLVIESTFEDNTIIKHTANHLFYDPINDNWSELYIKKSVMLDNGKIIKCIKQKLIGIIDVYDITVQHTHSFFANNILVHNCGEITMLGDSGVANIDGKEIEHMGDICNLGSLILCNFYDKEKGFLWEEFKLAIKVLVRTLDNIIDIATYPFEKIKNSAMLRRKIGCGLMGYGSLLYMIGLRYGSEKSNEFTEKLMHTYINTAYLQSTYLAKEKGSFPLFNKDKILENGYIKNSKNLTNEVIENIKKYGLRNSQLTTIAPTGNTSMLFGNVSSGCEPIFGIKTIRWMSITHKFHQVIQELGYECPNIAIGEFYETKDFKLIEEGGEEILISKCGNYKIDRHRGLIKKVECTDYGYKWCLENLSKEELKLREEKGIFVTAEELTAKEHLDPFIILSKYIDNSISKTINLKEDYPIEDFNNLFIKLWEEGGRGVTTYRTGTMTVVIEAKKEEKENINHISTQQEKFYEIWQGHENNGLVFENVKLPEEYPMIGYTLRSEGKKWRLHVAFKDRDMSRPFAIFVQTNHIEPNISTFNTLELLEKLALNEGIPKKWINDTHKKSKHQQNVVKITRMLGLLLRHNVDIGKIVKTLDNVDGLHVGSFVFRLKKFLSRFVKELENGKRCPICNHKLTLKEGCEVCNNCLYSRCA